MHNIFNLENIVASKLQYIILVQILYRLTPSYSCSIKMYKKIQNTLHYLYKKHRCF